MSLEELISLERIEISESKRLKETYLVYNLSLSKLFIAVLDNLQKEIINLIDMHILLYSLRYVPFVDEAVGLKILEALNDCLADELHEKSVQWVCMNISNMLNKLCELIICEYHIEGSLVVFQDLEIDWDLCVSISSPS